LATASNVKLSSRFENAMTYAFQLHANHRRKGSDIPYIAHLLGVTALVLEDGGDEDEAIAALLHDAVEDCGGLETLKDIRIKYGEHVAYIVDSCTDAYVVPKPPWRARKEHYIDHLRDTSPDVLRVSIADKLHNARSILWDLRQQGESIFERFNGGKEGTLWYYHTLLRLFQLTFNSPMVQELDCTIQAIELLLPTA
jgi:(p)ppGpp synthase/HD superfamily hydrolase